MLSNYVKKAFVDFRALTKCVNNANCPYKLPATLRVPYGFPSLMKYFPLLNYESKREKTILRIRYNRKNCHKHPYSKPLDFRSGDITTEQLPLKPSDIRLGFDDIEDWQDSEDLKKLYTMEYSDNGELNKKRLVILLEKYQEFPGDWTSNQAIIAWTTAKIRSLIPHCLTYRKDKIAKVQLMEYIGKRNRCLRKLFEKDRSKFHWIQEELQIKYLPHDKEFRKLTKKQSRMKAAKEACVAMKQAKLDEYQEKLAEEKEKFLIEKEVKLREIGDALKKLGIEADVESPLDVYKALGVGEPYITKPYIPKTKKQLQFEYNMKKFAHLRFKKVGPPKIINGVPQYT